MARYWVYVDSKIQGPVDTAGLRRVPGFNLLSQVCLEGEQTWSLADDVLEIKSYFLSPPRASALPPMEVGNTAIKVEPEAVAAHEAPPVRSGASPLSILSMGDNVLEELPPLDAASKPMVAPAPASDGKPGTLRSVCDICGYKNPRDVKACMKCGTPIAGASAAEMPAAEAPAEKKDATEAVAAAAPVAASPAADAPMTPVLEHKIVARPPWRPIAIGVAAAVVLSSSILGVRHWKKAHAPKPAAVPLIQMPEAPAPRRKHFHYSQAPLSSSTGERHRRLPGVTADEADTPRPTRSARSADTESPAPYRIVSEATPLRHRESSPLDSPYASKRRSDKNLWNAQQEQAVRQVQRARIYGGQRTVQRNVEILMQLLRDREYNTAFETGRRPYLYNDLDWSASVQDGPVYDVRLTFSGGREEDGTPRKPLRFAFKADLERGTVEPGGEENIRNNTLHAFFDESRIPPEERRPIAKDVEELVMAADPSASPLALDTVVRNFVATYNLAALKRVANAFGLDTVKKKMEHEPTLGKALDGGGGAKAKDPEIFEQMDRQSANRTRVASGANDVPTATEAQTQAPKSTAAANARALANGDFSMDRGSGHDRIIQASLSTTASPERIWEALTSYDRFKLFVPDVMESEREGQDGSAVIVHMVSLARWGIFVFRINLHLRLIERPQQHVIEFERIAGDFETFRGSFEIQTDPSTKRSTLVFHATLAPKGGMPSWMLSGMAKHFILPKLAAFCARAEAN